MTEQLITFKTFEKSLFKGFDDYTTHKGVIVPPTQALLNKWLREKHNILIAVYSNASGYLWEIMDAKGGTLRQWSELTGDDIESGTFTTFEKALEDAIQRALNSILIKDNDTN